jgi:hypothetical protein
LISFLLFSINFVKVELMRKKELIFLVLMFDQDPRSYQSYTALALWFAAIKLPSQERFYTSGENENKIVKPNVVKTGMKQNRKKQTSQTEKTIVGNMRPKDILAAVPPLHYLRK